MTLKFEFTPEETQAILDGLVNLQYARVADLVARIKVEGDKQLADQKVPAQDEAVVV